TTGIHSWFTEGEETGIGFRHFPRLPDQAPSTCWVSDSASAEVPHDTDRTRPPRRRPARCPPAAELLALSAARRDPEAFAGLVRRLGPLVMGPCRRVLGPSADAGAAFQAVFVALARRASSFRDGRALPAWLHRVSLRVARKALARRQTRGLTALG